ncbi:MAG: hypothetical protein KKC75_08400 [Nanoarchaeota archaeon]|nr:hypothetical protein [Nanoarchaeota archaeon]MBU1004492.1 hypothetical protein [Nanoarchaeota archaeon]MBU1945662.1 hypothetical protein [Nanoarchaeota archaeon]
MQTHDWCLVSLDAFSVDQLDEILLKKTPWEYMERPIHDILEYVLDPHQDGLNPGYNAEEKAVADMIKGWMDNIIQYLRGTGKAAESTGSSPTVSMGAERTFLRLAARRANANEMIFLGLEDKMKPYIERMLQQRHVPGADSSVAAPYIELYADGICSCCFCVGSVR